jgi:predicted aspartyl protease
MVSKLFYVKYRPEEVIGMGIFEVEIKVRNWQNRFLPEEERGEDVACDALVDSGAVQLSLPAQLVERFKLMELDQVRVHTADGAEHEYRVMGIAEVEVQGWRLQSLPT